MDNGATIPVNSKCDVSPHIETTAFIEATWNLWNVSVVTIHWFKAANFAARTSNGISATHTVKQKRY